MVCQPFFFSEDSNLGTFGVRNFLAVFAGVREGRVRKFHFQLSDHRMMQRRNRLSGGMFCTIELFLDLVLS